MLPTGFYDQLTPDAAREAQAAETLMRHFAAWGYGRVSPPLMEFEDTLLAGPGATLNKDTFRVMDPLSQRMLGIRTDHTLQIGRLAATRLAARPRPLRLSYAGATVQASAMGREPARQKMQIGFELIGTETPEADAEAIRLGISALQALGIRDISVDLLLPTLVPALLDASYVNEAMRAAIHHALERKDAAALKLAAGDLALSGVLEKLLQATGNADAALGVLKNISLPEQAHVERRRLEKVLTLLKESAVPFTVDLVEHRHFEYQSGLSFGFFSVSKQVELGRGGRYRTASAEPATGLTFYSSALMQVMPALEALQHIYVPFDVSANDATRLQKDGFVLVTALGAFDETQAKAQSCTYMWRGGKAEKI